MVNGWNNDKSLQHDILLHCTISIDLKQYKIIVLRYNYKLKIL